MANEHQEPDARDSDAVDSANESLSPAEEECADGPDSVVAGEIAALEKALDEARDQVLRTQAEMQNLRRRVERDIENAHKFALEKFVDDLLPVADNLERATATIDPGQRQANDLLNSLAEGVDLTLRGFLDVLGKHQVLAVDPVGQPFDPAFHQAVATVPHAQLPANRVVDVLQKGYTLNGRLVRPAMVVVAKGNDSG